MSYPERPICHEEISPYFKLREIIWEAREADGTYGVNLRHCSYCGSLHPEDLLKVLEIPGVHLEGADWKYGWPHKYYVDGIPNPMAGQIVKVGAHCWTDNDGVYHDEPTMGPAPSTLTKKFYNEHLYDLAGTPEFDLVAEAIRKRTGVKFEMREGKLYYITCQWDKTEVAREG